MRLKSHMAAVHPSPEKSLHLLPKCFCFKGVQWFVENLRFFLRLPRKIVKEM